MTMAIGALLVLLGAMMFHVASSDMPHSNIGDIWGDLKKIMSGQTA